MVKVKAVPKVFMHAESKFGLYFGRLSLSLKRFQSFFVVTQNSFCWFFGAFFGFSEYSPYSKRSRMQLSSDYFGEKDQEMNKQWY